jgi:peroxin-2
MTSADFAAAQQRIHARRQRHAAEASARLEAQLARQRSNRLTRLPYPLGSIALGGIQAWDTIKGREGMRPAFRVGQVDAELLDEELLELLKGQVGEALKYFGPHIRDGWSAEITLALRAILFKLSMWDHNASYGAALQGLRYTDARQKGLLLREPTQWQKGLYGLVTVFGRYAWNKWEDWLVEREGGYEEVFWHIGIGALTALADLASLPAAFGSCPAYRQSYRRPIRWRRSCLFSSSSSTGVTGRFSTASFASG